MSDSNHKASEGEMAALRRALDTEVRLHQETQHRLSRANTEFEEFVSMTAHNLREPLREVAAFSELLAESCAGRLDPDAGAYLDHIRQGAASMQSVLSAVVDYWAGEAADRQPSPVDMEEVLDQALFRAEKQMSARNAVVTHDPLPVVLGDFEILTKVLHHLIANAIAYGGATSPRVHVSSRRAEADWEILVRDNGPGIETVYHTRIFGVFKRLHGRECPGNGLGLAFCKKALESLGGRISVESTPGAGATFYFALPAP